MLAGDEVFLGNGDGTFRAGQLITGHGGVMTVADLNGDGKLDAIFGGEFGFTVLLGNGDGTFTATGSFGTGNLLAVLSLGDFNADGKLDVVAGAYDAMSTLLGNGDGTFQPDIDVGFVPWVSLIATAPIVADFNADGYPDIVFPTRFNTVSTALAVALATTVQLSPVSLSLGVVNVGTRGAPQSVTVTNLATTSLAIGSVGFGGANPDQFTVVSNNCGSNLASGASCTVSVSCSPTLAENLSASLLFSDNAPASPQSVLVVGYGMGTTPIAQFSPTSLTFASQPLGTTSPTQSIKMTNVGNASLSADAAIVGMNPGDFSLNFSPCVGTLSPGQSCTFTVDFAPSVLGTRSAQVAIVSNAPNSPQSIPLTGTGGPNLGLKVPTSGSSSAAVSAGSTASYTLSIGGAGSSGTASLTCTGAPKGAVCSVPASVTVAANTASTFKVSVTTTAPSGAMLTPAQRSVGWLWATALVGLLSLPGNRRSLGSSLRRFSWLPILLILFITSCGGGGSTSGGGGSGSGGTPSGTYTLTVKAELGSGSQSVNLTLIVQ